MITDHHLLFQVVVADCHIIVNTLAVISEINTLRGKQARKRVNRRLNLLIMMTAVGSLWLKVRHATAHDLEESAKSYLTEIG